MILAALIFQEATLGFLLWFIVHRDNKHNQRVDQLLTWIKDTPTAVVRTDNGHEKPKIAPSYMDDEEMVKLEAKYESEEAPAGPDAE
jgi:hypothetical protein